MSEPIPTPYDIIGIPYIPWEPSFSVWLVALLLFMAAATLLGVMAFFTARRPSERALNRLLTQLAGSQVAAPGIECERFSRLCRRILSFLAEHDLTGCSAQELRSLASLSGDPREVEALQLVALIEDHSYAPAGIVLDQPLPELFESAKRALAAFAAERRRR